MNGLSFFISGTPVPKGSAKAFVVKGRAIVTQDNRARQKPWASLIAYTAQEAGCRPSNQAIGISLQFTMPRPKSHYGTGKNSAVLKTTAPSFHTSKPDIDKISRLVLDALTGVAWVDDSQVCLMTGVSKRYGENPGVLIGIGEV